MAIELPVVAGFVESAKFWGRFGGMGRHVLLFILPPVSIGSDFFFAIFWIRNFIEYSPAVCLLG